jgi:hypothetical protein
MKVNNLFPRIAIPFRFAIRRFLGVALMAVAMSLVLGTAAWGQETVVTIAGAITATGISGVNIGDKYSMEVSYDPAQAPASTGTNAAFYNTFTLSITVFDTAGNQTFSPEAGEQLIVQDGPSGTLDNGFATTGVDGGFQLLNSNGTFKSTKLPTALVLADFSTALMIGPADDFQGSITSIKITNVGGIVPAFITAGLPDPSGKVPEVNGVAGSGVTNLDISFPLALLTHGSSYVYTIALQDVNFTGTCQASFTLTQLQLNKTVTLDTAKDETFSCGPGTIWFWSFSGKPIPDFPGPATLTGTVTYGTSKVSISSTVVFD